MRYFLDTEFNGFGGELISIALVPEDEARPHFYEAVTCREPTPWVTENVLPVLEVKPRSRAEVAKRFARYLHNDEAPLLVADWPEDIAHASRLLITGPGMMMPVRGLRFELFDPDLIIAGGEHPSAVPHNARHDAAALRAKILAHEVWEASFLKG
ncbi:hypothetical protein [Novosphingobium terrae]|uniref:hypothetical protein n=1 Tax=Novosphingobium terrae TaxID=2726189 RepID=UPI00197D7BC9|nr:hypothetical protein [Novosphingobium terrae]